MITLEQAMIIVDREEKRAKNAKDELTEEERKNWEERCKSFGPAFIIKKAKKHKTK